MVTPPQDQPGHVGPGGASNASGPDGRGDFKQTARELGDEAKAEGKAGVEHMRESAAGKADTLAESARAAASQLRGDDIGHLSEYVSELADSMGRLSSNLRDKSGDEIIHEVGRLARENPALLVTGSIAIGFGLARFARASTPATTALPVETDSPYYSAQAGSTASGASGASAGASTTSTTSTASPTPHTGTTPDTRGGIH